MTLTYLQFHAVFTLPAALALGTATVVRPKRSEVRPVGVAVVVAVALAYTIPWDNYLLARGVWDYGPGRVVRTVWRAPIEEYLFITVQPVLTALWVHLLGRPPVDLEPLDLADRARGAVPAGVIALVGLAALAGGRTFYLGAILAWAAPVLALQWAVGWRYLRRRWRTVAIGVGVPTAYLWVADAVAIRLGVWRFSPDLTTGLAVFGLPVEEALFFLVTNCFVVQALLLYPWVVDRWT
jgi:lycopene cyclase domain-containing protein